MSKLVFSTETGKQPKKNKKETTPNTEGPIKVRIEKKGRGGKSVTVIYNLPFSKDDAKDIKKQLSNKLGTGSTYKEGRIEIQGDHVSKVVEFFNAKSMKAVKAGG
jgi:translation initiation factor 1